MDNNISFLIGLSPFPKPIKEFDLTLVQKALARIVRVCVK